MVYETMDVERGVRVALKTVIHHDADALARFKHEFRALQDIHHPNLVGLGELVADEDDVFFTMELIEGVDLLTYVRGDARRVDGSGAQTVVDVRRAADMTFIDPPRGATIIDDNDATPHDGPLVVASEAAAFDEARLRDAFKQIALGLSALHEANKVHRDIKPSNIRVTPEGRVVLLDFGLVLKTDDSHDAELSIMAGTPAYMAPEQVSSSGVGPEADWYAMGVVMYQCLTGRRPFEGTTMDVMAAKLVRDPPPPSALVANIPRDLDALCMELLRVEKSDRPIAGEVLERLDANVLAVSGAHLAQSGSNAFVGRARELVELARGFADVVAGRAVTIAVQGESGVGKSCLVKRFLDEVLPAQGEEVLVLTGRCYEREAVPYKAFDEVIDALSRKLARMEKEELVPLLPDHLEDLTLLFPALLRAPLIAQQTRGQGLDPHERRRHAFDAARDLFSRLARRHRLVLSIDDLQWTDADSLQLLGDLLAPPGAPPMLLIATVRNDPDAPGARPSVLASLPGDVRVVSIERLATDDARELAARLLQRVAPGAADAAAIAKEAGGHPLFIDELVRHLALTSGTSPVATLRLDDALAARVDRLDPGARRVLEIACVIGAPISQETVAHAAALEMREFVRVVALLRTSNLVRTSGARVNDAMQPYHDRVREALVARMDPATARDCHEHIASALEVSKAFDPEVLASHWAGAGKPAKAAKYAVVAAEQAASALAFDRAARLYEWAIALLPEGDPRRNALRRQLGDALSSAGKGGRAAAEYELAASHANPADAIDLRRRAASQLLRTGDMARGIEVSRTVLGAVGMRLPQTTLGAVVALLWFRFLLRLRGLDFTPLDESRIAPEDILRLDACSSVADTLAYADALRGAVFHTRHLLLALRLGETRRIARALGAECAYLAARGSKTWARTQRVIARAHEVGERAGTPEARASVLAFTGPAYVVNMRYATAIDELQKAITIFREQVPGSVWEVTTLRFFLFMAYNYLSRFGEQRAQQEAALKDALERGDRYAAVMLRIGVLNRIWWMAGDPARARRELDAAVRDWPTGSGAFDMIHFHQLIGYGYIELYEGSGVEAYARVQAAWPVLRRAFLLHLEPIRLEVCSLRARAALSAALDPKCTDREPLVRDAERSLRELEGLDVPMIRWVVRSIKVGIAALRNRPDEVNGCSSTSPRTTPRRRGARRRSRGGCSAPCAATSKERPSAASRRARSPPVGWRRTRVSFAFSSRASTTRRSRRARRVLRRERSHHEQPAQRHVDPASHHAQHAGALARRDSGALRELGARLVEQVLARALHPACGGRAMRTVERAELVDREPVDEVLMEKVLLARVERPQRRHERFAEDATVRLLHVRQLGVVAHRARGELCVVDIDLVLRAAQLLQPRAHRRDAQPPGEIAAPCVLHDLRRASGSPHEQLLAQRLHDVGHVLRSQAQLRDGARDVRQVRLVERTKRGALPPRARAREMKRVAHGVGHGRVAHALLHVRAQDVLRNVKLGQPAADGRHGMHYIERAPGKPMSPCLSEDAVLAFIGGKTAGPTRRASEAHLSECSDCRALVSELARKSGASGEDVALAHAATVLSPPAAHGSPPVLPGQVVGDKYEVEWPIGAGGMGVVVAAVHKVLGQRVAIKFPLPELRRASEGRERLIREARACAQLRSEYAVRLLDVGQLDDGSPYVVMEYLVGRTLGERLVEEGPMPLAEAVDSLVQACEALEEAHAKGIVHRDLKPSNLFETHRFDGSRVVKVLDFGIAKAPAFRGEEALTITHDVMGSPAYMAPEQLRSTRDVDARADIWALGVSLRELLTGKLEEAPVQPPGVERIVKRCLQIDPAQRFASARELAVALAPFGSDVATGIAARLAVAKKSANVRVPLAAAIAIACVIAGGVGWMRAGTPETATPTPTATPTANANATANADASPPHPVSRPPRARPAPPPDTPDPHGLSDRK